MSGNKLDKGAAPGLKAYNAPSWRAETRCCHMLTVIWTRVMAIKRGKEEKKKKDILKEEFKYSKDWLKRRQVGGRL